MNRSAYLTTGFAIKALSSLSRADIKVHGKEHLPDGPTIFVMNHFTRVETFILPYVLYNLTQKPVWSLAAASLFRGGLEKFFNLVGVVSTRDPDRDRLIISSLLTGEANWIIFPEGSMVKTKKIMSRGRYMIAAQDKIHEPHTGAAALALQAELFRGMLLNIGSGADGVSREQMARALDLESTEQVQHLPITIVPVNLTYYPIRAAVNIASDIASKLVKDIPDRMVEEIMTEGTMLLSGVDLDIRIGRPISVRDYLEPAWSGKGYLEGTITGYSVPEHLRQRMRKVARDVMHRYMHDIYSMTTVNHEHLFASLLRLYPLRKIRLRDFLRRVFLVAAEIREEGVAPKRFFLHRSLHENQAHLLTDDRFHKFSNFLQLAEEKGVVHRVGDCLLRDRSKLSAPLSFHRGRIDNPVEVMANEVEPLTDLIGIVRRMAWLPPIWIRLRLVRFLLGRERKRYLRDCGERTKKTSGTMCSGMPILLPGYRFGMGVLLVHSYLAIPEEMRRLALALRRRGYWVYALRLPGHGTSPEDLARRSGRNWVEAVENGYLLLSSICTRVVVGGIGVGGSLALDLASRVGPVAGVFAICPPYDLKDYSTRLMPGQDVWNRLLSRLKGGNGMSEFLEFEHGNPHVNYRVNPVRTIREVAELLDSLKECYRNIHQPSLILQADANPVVNPEGSRELFDEIGSVRKEYCLLSSSQHVMVEGEMAEKVFRRIAGFVDNVYRGGG